MKNTRRKLQLGISNHNYKHTAGSKQSVGNAVMKYAIAVTISCNKKNMPVRINDICMYICIYVCVYVYVCIHTCIYVCMYASYVCMYVCIIYICVCIVPMAIKLCKNKLNSPH